MDKVINMLLFAGVSENEYVSVREEIWEENRKVLTIFSLIIAILFGAIGTLNCFVEVFEGGRAIYFAVCSAAFLTWIHCITIGKKKPVTAQGFIYGLSLFVYGATAVMSYLSPNARAVAFIVALIMIPLLFIDRPLIQIVITVTVVIFYNYFTMMLKPYSVARVDYWNAIACSVISISAEIFFNKIHLENVMQKRKLRILSETDILTGVMNRNRFDKDAEDYARKPYPMTLILIDAAELYNLRNMDNHMKGEEFLRELAEVLANKYHKENIYRISAAEFVVVNRTQPKDYLRMEMTKIQHQQDKNGYHLAVGIVEAGDSKKNYHELLEEAENNKYNDKLIYYADSAHDRRSHT